MKTATLPAIRVSPELRDAAQRVLRPDETLSRLVESSLRAQIAYREAQEEFISRGLKAAEEARETDTWHSAASVLAEMETRLQAARKKSAASPRARKSRR